MNTDNENEIPAVLSNDDTPSAYPTPAPVEPSVASRDEDFASPTAADEPVEAAPRLAMGEPAPDVPIVDETGEPDVPLPADEPAQAYVPPIANTDTVAGQPVPTIRNPEHVSGAESERETPAPEDRSGKSTEDRLADLEGEIEFLRALLGWPTRADYEAHQAALRENADAYSAAA